MARLRRPARRPRTLAVLTRIPPPGLLAALYALLICLGTLLLMLPVAQHGEVSWSDALFTSTSAVTVTGLVVADTGTAFTLFGQAVIAVLIQLGGLGLMTFAALVLSALGIPIGLPQRMVLREDLGQTSLSNLGRLARLVLIVALVCEAIGTFVLAAVFVPEFGLWPGLWQAAFHTVSAFNNAGFALHPDSLSRWVAHPVINIAVPTMFILGGLGFVVVGEIVNKRRWRAFSLHTKLMIVGSAVLAAVSFACVALLEWHNPETLGGLDGASARLQAAWFQAVTPRTAGFNTLDTAAMHESTALLTMALMMIGGGSTSTAGGIKVTSFIVLLLATLAFFRRREEPHVFGRSLGAEEVLRVMALATLSTVIVFLASFAIAIGHDGDMFDLGFEVVSAFGTVGLSRGATAELDPFGRAIIVAVMFLGRVGPLTLGFFLATRRVARVKYPKGQIYLG